MENKKISRRSFLRTSVFLASGLTLAACGPAVETVAPTGKPADIAATATVAPTKVPDIQMNTTPTAAPTATKAVEAARYKEAPSLADLVNKESCRRWKNAFLLNRWLSQWKMPSESTAEPCTSALRTCRKGISTAIGITSRSGGGRRVGKEPCRVSPNQWKSAPIP